MRHPGWGFFPWPLLFVAPMIAMAVLMMLRSSHRGGGMGPGCGSAGWSAHPTPPPPPPLEDPMVLLRDRFVRGEIDLAEYETRLDALLRSDPAESMPWWGQPIGPEPARKIR